MKLREEARKKTVKNVVDCRKDLVSIWIREAYEDCLQEVSKQDHAVFGGTLFQSKDPTTYWTDPNQFFGWWKNNAERKSKFEAFVRDANNDNIKFKEIQKYSFHFSFL